LKNYFITENQLHQIIENVTKEIELTLGDAMRVIVSTLRTKGYEDEQIVDFMIALRQKDPYTIYQAHELDGESLFKKAVEKLLFSVSVE